MASEILQLTIITNHAELITYTCDNPKPNFNQKPLSLSAKSVALVALASAT